MTVLRQLSPSLLQCSIAESRDYTRTAGVNASPNGPAVKGDRRRCGGCTLCLCRDVYVAAGNIDRVDARTGKVESQAETGVKVTKKGGIDQVAFDPKLGLVYTFDGGAKGFDVYDANTMKPATFVSTGVATAHTGDVDTAARLVFAYHGENDTLGIFKPVR